MPTYVPTAAKKLFRYLKRRPRLVQVCGEDSRSGCIDVCVDSDWVGCPRTRKSTNGGAIVAFGKCVRVWSSTQTVVARSSGEAEYYAVVKGASEGMGLQSMCKELGMELALFVWTDSSACRGICCRTGLGKLRHMDVQLLWLQALCEGDKPLSRGRWQVESSGSDDEALGSERRRQAPGHVALQGICCVHGFLPKTRVRGECEERDLKLRTVAPGGA